jgi:hypothetical protein
MAIVAGLVHDPCRASTGPAERADPDFVFMPAFR